MIDLYCERTGPGILNEPLNAFTNIAFFIAAYFVWQLAKKENVQTFGVNLLIIVLIAIGIGSSLFHTFATKWALWLDVIPISIFQIIFLWLYSIKVIKLNYLYSALLMILFFALSFVAGMFPKMLNGSMSYSPGFILLLGLGLFHYLSSKNEKFIMLIASGLFVLSLTFRSMDNLICDCISFGTHFLWHSLNGLLLYLLIRVLIKNYSIKTL